MLEPSILVVDDEPLNLEIIAEFLEEDHYSLQFAGTGEEAWEMLNTPGQVFDLVVLDRRMPGMDGVDLLRLIKADSKLSSLPVIMQTAAGAPEQVKEGIEAGAYYYLIKPYDPDSLQTIVRAALDDARGRADLEQMGRTQIRAIHWLQDAHLAYRTVEEAREIGVFLSGLCPTPDMAVIGLVELLVNAIEHGNLGISYADKTRLRQEGTWDHEVRRRLLLPENRQKRAEVAVVRAADELAFTIRDQGSGFDWRKYLEFDPARAFDPNGRGIAMAKQLSFSRLEYGGRGNVVLAAVKLSGFDRDAAASNPAKA
ncbi:MAG: response regulator [Rhodocyclaceae bacterium]|nr:response regulator [Rhodocyclaceae bacterium]